MRRRDIAIWLMGFITAASLFTAVAASFPHERLYMNEDIEFTTYGYGPILMHTNGSKWIACLEEPIGTNTVVDCYWLKIASSPEIPMEERLALMKSTRKQRQQDRVDFNAAGQLQDKVNIIAEHLGLKDR